MSEEKKGGEGCKHWATIKEALREPWRGFNRPRQARDWSADFIFENSELGFVKVKLTFSLGQHCLGFVHMPFHAWCRELSIPNTASLGRVLGHRHNRRTDLCKNKQKCPSDKILGQDLQVAKINPQPTAHAASLAPKCSWRVYSPSTRFYFGKNSFCNQIRIGVLTFE